MFVVLALLGANAVFVAGEFALVAVDRRRVDRAAEEGQRRARIAQSLLRDLTLQLSGLQVGITASSLGLGFVTEPVVGEALEPVLRGLGLAGSADSLSVPIGLALATVFQLVIGELVPKGIALADPLRATLLLAVPLQAFGLVFGPLMRLITRAGDAVVRRLGMEPQHELASVRSLEEIELLLRSSQEVGTLDRASFRLLTRTFRFGRKTAADVLVSRTAVKGLETTATVSDLIALSVETGFSRFPVYRDSLDDVTGVVHIKDVYRVAFDRRPTTTVAELASEIPAVPESLDLQSLLPRLSGTGNHLAIVIDEFGGTAGIVTLEDLLEEIVGEIRDEHDREPLAELTVPMRTDRVEVDGTLHLDELEDLCGLVLPDGDYETVAGFVVERLGRLGQVGDVIELDGARLEVLATERHRTSRLLVTVS